MDYQHYQHLTVTKEDNIFTVTLDRPEVKNAINHQLHDELSQIFADLDRDEDCDVVVITGAGDSFCAGGDLNWVLEQNKNGLAATAAGRTARRIQTSVLELEKPIIAKVRRSAIGLGASVALACDFVYATPDTKFADPHVAVGLVAGDGGSYLWPQLVGYAKARRYLLTGDAIRGDEADRIGLITEAVPEEQLDEVVATMARRLAAGATHAIRWTKASINAGLRASALAVLDRATAFENLTQMLNDNRIACEAFLAKEQPKFTGS